MSSVLVCHNWKDFMKGGEPAGCLREADPAYDMDFTDVKPGAILHWCTFCGPREAAMGAAFAKFVSSSPENFQKARDAIEAERGKVRS
jgi:hypothetical protein